MKSWSCHQRHSCWNFVGRPRSHGDAQFNRNKQLPSNTSSLLFHLLLSCFLSVPHLFSLSVPSSLPISCLPSPFPFSLPPFSCSFYSFLLSVFLVPFLFSILPLFFLSLSIFSSSLLPYIFSLTPLHLPSLFLIRCIIQNS